jgi:hypothetical protein
MMFGMESHKWWLNTTFHCQHNLHSFTFKAWGSWSGCQWDADEIWLNTFYQHIKTFEFHRFGGFFFCLFTKAAKEHQSR